MRGRATRGERMQVGACIRAMVRERGASMRGLSVDMGRSPDYVRVMGTPTRSPALATVAEIADALGYDVAIIDRETGERLGTIDPPARD